MSLWRFGPVSSSGRRYRCVLQAGPCTTRFQPLFGVSAAPSSQRTVIGEVIHRAPLGHLGSAPARQPLTGQESGCPDALTPGSCPFPAAEFQMPEGAAEMAAVSAVSWVGAPPAVGGTFP